MSFPLTNLMIGGCDVTIGIDSTYLHVNSDELYNSSKQLMVVFGKNHFVFELAEIIKAKEKQKKQ